MTAFIIIAVLMVVIALAVVLIPLFRRVPESSGVVRTDSNVALLRDQLAELDNDLKRGVLSAERYLESKTELERRAIEESKSAEPVPVQSRTRTRSYRAIVAAVLVLVPAAAVGLYMWLGNPAGLSPQTAASPHDGSPHAVSGDQMEAMVAQLAARMEQAPNDPDGWDMLARSYSALHRYDKAVLAYERLVKLVPDNADVFANYADALAMANGQKLEGKPMELVKRALALDPKHWKALAISGSNAFAHGNYRAAADFWERSLANLPDDAQEMKQAIMADVEESRKLAGISTPSKITAKTAPATSAKASTGAKAKTKTAAGLSGKVSLAPALAGRTSPQDTVFIFARAEGQRAPVAILRKTAGELPFDFSLDDSNTMMPGATLSAFDKLTIGVRVSKSGNAMPQPGDMEGFSAPVKPGTSGVSVVIDHVRPQ